MGSVEKKVMEIVKKIHSPQGTTIGEIRKILGHKNIDSTLDCIKKNGGPDLAEILKMKPEDFCDECYIRGIEVEISDNPGVVHVIEKLFQQDGISLGEIKQLTGWTQANLIENMKRYAALDLGRVPAEYMTDGFRIRKKVCDNR